MASDYSFTEKLIEYVKKYKVLYDLTHPQYKNVRVKNKCWDEIASDINIEGIGGDDLKKKWENLCDNYAKFLRSEKTHTGQGAKFICRYKTWPWAQHMEPFRRFITFAKTDSNVSAPATAPTPVDSADEVLEHEVHNEDMNLQQSHESLAKENTEATPAVTPRASNLKRKRAEAKNVGLQPSSQQQSSVDKVISYLQERNSDRYKDDLDQTFLGYAATARKLSAKRQAIIKYEFAKILMNAELEEIMEKSRVTQMDSTNWSSASNVSNLYSDIASPPTDTSESRTSSARAWYEDFSDAQAQLE